MTEVARLLEGIDEDGVEFRPNYNSQSKEPVVLPGGFPNLLANGSQGIAVGMATPPHDAAELCDAALHLIDKPDAKSKSLLKWVKGPDFPTGGLYHHLNSKESIAQAYMTGRGSFRTRASGPGNKAPGRRHHRDPVAGQEVPAGREDRRTAESCRWSATSATRR